jgi:cysteine-rich repeat protein
MERRSTVALILVLSGCGRVNYGSDDPKPIDASSLDAGVGFDGAAIDAHVDMDGASLDANASPDAPASDAWVSQPSEAGLLDAGPDDSGALDSGALDSGPPDAPRADARVVGCGDRAVSIREECDDGNTLSGDGCDATCRLEDQGPGGETCFDRKVLQLVPTSAASLSASATGDLSLASDNFTCSLDTAGNGASDQVFAFGLDATSDVSISAGPTAGPGNLILSVRGVGGRSCPDTAGEISCVDDSDYGGSETIALPALPAGIYYVFVDQNDYFPNPGPYRLEVSVTPLP